MSVALFFGPVQELVRGRQLFDSSSGEAMGTQAPGEWPPGTPKDRGTGVVEPVPASSFAGTPLQNPRTDGAYKIYNISSREVDHPPGEQPPGSLACPTVGVKDLSLGPNAVTAYESLRLMRHTRFSVFCGRERNHLLLQTECLHPLNPSAASSLLRMVPRPAS